MISRRCGRVNIHEVVLDHHRVRDHPRRAQRPQVFGGHADDFLADFDLPLRIDGGTVLIVQRHHSLELISGFQAIRAAGLVPDAVRRGHPRALVKRELVDRVHHRDQATVGRPGRDHHLVAARPRPEHLAGFDLVLVLQADLVPVLRDQLERVGHAGGRGRRLDDQQQVRPIGEVVVAIIALHQADLIEQRGGQLGIVLGIVVLKLGDEVG